MPSMLLIKNAVKILKDRHLLSFLVFFFFKSGSFEVIFGGFPGVLFAQQTAVFYSSEVKTDCQSEIYF